MSRRWKAGATSGGRRRVVGVVAAAVVAGLAVVVALGGAPAAEAVADPYLPASDGGAAAAAAVPPGMARALQRDLGLSPAEASARRSRADVGRSISDQLGRDLGQRFGGAWLTDNADQVVVGVTDWSRAAQIRRAGAKPVRVRHSWSELEALHGRLSSALLPGGRLAEVVYIDPIHNQVVVESHPERRQAVAAGVGQAAVDSSAVRIIESARPVVTTQVRGGDRIRVSGSGGTETCSAGFGVESSFSPEFKGFVTAGHCGRTASRVSANGSQGVVTASNFPGTDHAMVVLNQASAATPFVNNNGFQVGVTGFRATPNLGEIVCRSGQSTGWRCGRIEAFGVTAVVRNDRGDFLGMVFGFVKTSACADPGDSGGPFLSNTEAVGIQSSSQGNCANPLDASAFYQPILPVLQTYRLNLLTVGGSVPTPPSPIPPLDKLRVVETYCGPQSGLFVTCTVVWTGGDDRASAAWTLTPTTPFTVTTSGILRFSRISITCPRFSIAPARIADVRVTDFFGDTDTGRAEFYCEAEDPEGIR